MGSLREWRLDGARRPAPRRGWACTASWASSSTGRGTTTCRWPGAARGATTSGTPPGGLPADHASGPELRVG
eukprot:9581189-Alexandrium_andersonii.AAC.1